MSHFAVILAPVIDPHVTARQVKLAESGDLALDGVKHVLGPYDEAALETALALRDERPGSTVTALVFGGNAVNEALRYAMALKVDAVRWIDIAATAVWDARAMAKAVADAVRSLERAPDLILAGPEFGDRDDGLVPPLAARLLDLPFFAWAYRIDADADSLTLVRDAGEGEERVTTGDSMMATVSTHPSVRLRLPLLKNIMAANRKPVELASAAAGPAATRLIGVSLAGGTRKRGGGCRMLEGSAEDRATELARLVRMKVQA